MACGWTLLALSAVPPSPAGASEPTLAVTAIGALPGMKIADVPAYLSGQLNALGTGWRFLPVAAGAKPPPDRIEWSFEPSASAAGAVRTYGFSRFIMQRLIGVHPFVTVEATLYLHDEYQTRSIGQVGASDGRVGTDLADEIARDTRQLIAYSQMDTRADLAPERKATPPS
jgi:hypothetical protein